MEAIEQRVQRYWTARAHDFAAVRRNELKDTVSGRWLDEFRSCFSDETPLDVLDVGTGSGYFAILLARQGHRVLGVDLTADMLEEAAAIAEECGVAPRFLQMDAQRLDLPDDSFDVVVTRNLTWTLPSLETAYAEWLRVLRPGGMCLNFDANYAINVRNKNQSYAEIDPSGVYGHIGLTKEMERENAEITMLMPASSKDRPSWDTEVMRRCGYVDVRTDTDLGKRVLRERDLPDAPMFLLYGKKAPRG